MSEFDDMEVHLRQRAQRDWTEDRDVRICIDETDRLRAGRLEMGATLESDDLLVLAGPSSSGLVIVLPSMTAAETTRVLVEVLREQERIRRQR